MQEHHLFEYAVIRIVPRVEREEFLNVGVILFCKKTNFLQAMFSVNEARLRALYDQIDLAEVKEYIQAFENISKGGKDSGPIGKLDAASRFRWLTATRSTIIQSSKIHPGFSKDPQETLARLHTQLVL